MPSSCNGNLKVRGNKMSAFKINFDSTEVIWNQGGWGIFSAQGNGKLFIKCSCWCAFDRHSYISNFAGSITDKCTAEYFIEVRVLLQFFDFVPSPLLMAHKNWTAGKEWLRLLITFISILYYYSYTTFSNTFNAMYIKMKLSYFGIKREIRKYFRINLPSTVIPPFIMIQFYK